MEELYFFAAPDDLAAVLRDLEADKKLSYFKKGRFDSDRLQEYESGLQLPRLGEADSDSAVTCTGYLVLESPTRPAIRSLSTYEGMRFFVDQLVNHDSVVFTPGGLWKDHCLIRGSVSSAHATPVSNRLIRQFKMAFSRHTTKVKRYYVGPRAETFLRAGSRRFTVSADGSPEYDLTMGFRTRAAHRH